VSTKGVVKFAEELKRTAAALATPGKGLLAADEGAGTIGNRFERYKIPNTPENRHAWREILFTCPLDWPKYISGVILHEETAVQKTKDGVPFIELLHKRGVIAGIKVDEGMVDLDGTDGETATIGLDTLGKRCEKWYNAGIRFAKWRSTIKISAHAPSEYAIIENAHGLARYAVVCQEHGLVPIIEPEVLTDGKHSIEVAAAVTQRVQAAVVKFCHDYRLLWEGALLKPSMVLTGSESGQKVTPEEVAKHTVAVLARCIPPALPGIMFLSGGQSEEEGALNLNAINQYSGHKKPWSLAFSYGRALQQSALKAWLGSADQTKAAQEAFFARAKACGEAALGQYKGGAGGAAATADLHVKNYTY